MSISSPCLKKCALDVDNVCTGCLRHLEEIASWRRYNDAQKQSIYDRLKLLTNVNEVYHD